MSTSVTVKSGETLFLGEMPKVIEGAEADVPAKEEGEPARFRTLVFLKARVLPAK